MAGITFYVHNHMDFKMCEKGKNLVFFYSIDSCSFQNFTSKAVHEALASCFTNKYSEGYPGAR
jgi:glycine/serine hydroxymethyltransferase